MLHKIYIYIENCMLSEVLHKVGVFASQCTILSTAD